MTQQDPNHLPTSVEAPKQTGRSRRKRRLLKGVGLFFFVALSLCCYMGVLGGNVRTVVPGKVYRSAQLAGSAFQPRIAQMVGNSFDAVLQANQIRTVINLRGGSADDDWYREEKAVCAQDSVVHVDIPISARFLPPPDRLNKLLTTFDTAQYPLLIHCQAGADRTGLASVLYAHLYEKLPLDQAQATQLTWHYGHISWGKAHAMSDFFALYRREGKGMGLREWIEKRYPALYATSPLKMPLAAADVKVITTPAAQQTAKPRL